MMVPAGSFGVVVRAPVEDQGAAPARCAPSVELRTTIFPTARVFRRLEQGAEQNVVDYYAMVVDEVGNL